ncbi:MAG: DUF5400 domain-containing protein [Methanocaldococcus sp.]
MDKVIGLISLSVIFGSMLSGFATFRLTGMRLMPHFASLILAFILTLVALFINNNTIDYLAILFQIITPLTVCPTICNILKTQFQNTGIYSAHLALMGMLFILALGNLILF